MSSTPVPTPTEESAPSETAASTATANAANPKPPTGPRPPDDDAPATTATAPPVYLLLESQIFELSQAACFKYRASYFGSLVLEGSTPSSPEKPMTVQQSPQFFPIIKTFLEQDVLDYSCINVHNFEDFIQHGYLEVQKILVELADFYKLPELLLALDNVITPAMWGHIRKRMNNKAYRPNMSKTTWIGDFSQVGDLTDVYAPGSNFCLTKWDRLNATGGDFSDSMWCGSEIVTTATFVKAQLKNANMARCKIPRTSFAGAVMIGASLSNCVLSRCNFAGALMSKASLINSDLTGADFSKANLTSTNMSSCNLTNAVFSKADCTQLQLDKTTMNGADFSDCNLTGQNFSNLDLSYAFFDGADLSGVNFTDADLRCVSMWSEPLLGQTKAANIEGALCVRTKLQCVDLREVNCRKVDFTGANLTNCVLPHIADIRMGGANLQSAIMIRVSRDQMEAGQAQPRRESKIGGFKLPFGL